MAFFSGFGVSSPSVLRLPGSTRLRFVLVSKNRGTPRKLSFADHHVQMKVAVDIREVDAHPVECIEPDDFGSGRRPRPLSS